MPSVNKVIIMGRLGADPEIRRTQSGDPVVSMRVATSEPWRDKNTGEKKERTEWHTVVIFNKRYCEVAEQYLRKGNLVYLEGMLCTRKWEDQSGQARYSTEVVLKEFRSDLQLMPQGNGGRPGASSPDDYGQESGRTERRHDNTSQAEQSPGMRDVLDDEIPF